MIAVNRKKLNAVYSAFPSSNLSLKDQISFITEH